MAHAERKPLVPNTWQPDFMTDMRKVTDQIACGNVYPGYPRLFSRLHLADGVLEYTPDGRPILPYDPYAPFTVHDHPGSNDLTEKRPETAFHDYGQTLSKQEGMRLRWRRGGLDNRNFPLHPFWKEMVTDKYVRGVVSAGYYWQLGPNDTADLAALTVQETKTGPSLHALTVVRGDTGQHALPGGHLENGEVGIAGAVREALEETGVDLRHLTPVRIWEGLVADPRLTLHAGPRTTLALLDVKDPPTTLPKGQDDAEHAEWRVMNREWITNTFGSHGSLGMLAVRRWQRLNGMVVRDDGTVIPRS